MHKKRTYGAGNIEKRGGRFRVRLRMPDGSVGNLGTFTTHVEAEGVLAAALDEVAGGVRRVEATTLLDYGERWLERRALRHRNAEKDRSVWRMHVASASFARQPIGTIEAEDVVAWVNVLSATTAVSAVTIAGQKVLRETKRPLSKSTITKAYKLARMCIDDAMVEKLAVTNPVRSPLVAKALKSISSATTEEAWTYLTEDEIAAVAASKAITERQRLTILFAIYSGLRQGEIWGLRWADVKLDADTPEMTVRFSYEDGPTKSGKPEQVPLLPAAVEVLRRWKPLAPSSPRLGLVFPNPDGGCYAEGYDAGWADTKDGRRGKVTRGLKARIGIARPVRFHDLRHYPGCRIIPRRWWQAAPTLGVSCSSEHRTRDNQRLSRKVRSASPGR